MEGVGAHADVEVRVAEPPDGLPDVGDRPQHHLRVQVVRQRLHEPRLDRRRVRRDGSPGEERRGPWGWLGAVAREDAMYSPVGGGGESARLNLAVGHKKEGDVLLEARFPGCAEGHLTAGQGLVVR